MVLEQLGMLQKLHMLPNLDFTSSLECRLASKTQLRLFTVLKKFLVFFNIKISLFVNRFAVTSKNRIHNLIKKIAHERYLYVTVEFCNRPEK